MNLNINKIQFSITSKCNRKCQHCSLGITYNINKHDNNYEYLYKYSKYFSGLEIAITGGEPTCHYDFSIYVRAIKEIYKPKKYKIFTNAFNFKKYEKVFEIFDELIITRYEENEIFNYIKKTKDSKKYVIYNAGKRNKLPCSNGFDQPCERVETEGMLLFDGKLYPCCAGSGVDIKNFIIPTHTWRKDIINIKPSCHLCPWATDLSRK
jgi:hypothetical protein